MNKHRISLFYSHEDGLYVANFPDLEHCCALGETPEEALSEVLKAKEAWLKAAANTRKWRPACTKPPEEIKPGACRGPPP